MSRLQLLILWVLAIGAGSYYFNSKDVPDSISKKTDLEVGSKIVSAELVETLDGLTINSGDEQVSLKKVEGQWVVSEKKDFPANLRTTFLEEVNEVNRVVSKLNLKPYPYGFVFTLRGFLFFLLLRLLVLILSVYSLLYLSVR